MRPLAAAVLFGLCLGVHGPQPAAAQSGLNQTGSFLGAWCAQGDPNRRASIAANGPFNLSLTNENGSTSNGNQITAPDWNVVQGTLSADGRTINWSNNTYWSRCSRRYIDVQGTWYVGGDQTKPCRIDQRSGNLRLRNESGQTATGRFTGGRQIATVWSGTPIGGTISRDHNRIDWDNGTYWTR
jgi:hypothetical protein